jgi:hypothetical protein
LYHVFADGAAFGSRTSPQTQDITMLERRLHWLDLTPLATVTSTEGQTATKRSIEGAARKQYNIDGVLVPLHRLQRH